VEIRFLRTVTRLEGDEGRVRRAALWPQPARPCGSFPGMRPLFDFGGRVARTISAVMRFDTAIEVTTSQLRIELMFAADEADEAYCRTAAGQRRP